MTTVTKFLAALLLCAWSLVGQAVTITYFHNDPSGTPIMATDAAGQEVWRETYRPYGERLNLEDDSNTNRVWFHGKPYDTATGLSYMGARYYHPAVGRFMGVDPAPVTPDELHSFNRYAYANNNPYRFVDPDGHSPIDVAFLMWDIGKLGVAMYTGVGVGAAAADVVASTVGVFSPVPFTGQAIKAARAAERAVEAVRAADHVVDAAKAAKAVKSSTPRNAHLAGTTHPKTGIPFDKNGFPDFSSVAKAEVKITQTGNRAGDFRTANKAAGLKETPKGYTWHHHQDGTTMQLVPRDIHNATGHTGGFTPGL